MNSFKSIIFKTPITISLIAVLLAIYDMGFNQSLEEQYIINNFFYFNAALGIVSLIVKALLQKSVRSFKVILFDLMSLLFFGALLLLRFGIVKKNFFHDDYTINILLHTSVFLVFVREFSALHIVYKRAILNPAQIFILSFLFIIISGSLLLKLPNATTNGISYVDALFTSTSAVCVTGLSVVDTGTYFTGFGITIIAILIQIGGLGILTFASYFSYFFRGGTSYENHLMLGDMSNVDKLGEVFSTLKNIIVVTFTIELIGAILIFINISDTVIPELIDRIYFSLFHSVSGFCNAGFSTLPNNLYESTFRFNYPIHLTIAMLITFGGLGFPIVFNIVKYVKHIIKKIISFSSSEKVTHIPWVINLNSRIVLITSTFLLVFGTFFFYIFEYNNTLAEHSGFGKLIISFFGAVTPRTAGFNVVDNAALTFPTLMIILFLMWVGASPASTGGGIKTTTFAIAILNFISIARGKTRIEIFRREIADSTVRRALATIALSLIIIGTAIFLLVIFEKSNNLMGIAFECFSAFSTVGLSIGLTPKLTDASKLVLVVVMFIGRVSMLSILIALVKKEKHKYYRYPTEELLIN